MTKFILSSTHGDWTSSRLSNIPDYQRAPILIYVHTGFFFYCS